MTAPVLVGLTCDACLNARHYRCEGCACTSCNRGMSAPDTGRVIVERPRLKVVKAPKDPPALRLVESVESLRDEMAEGLPLPCGEPATERVLSDLLARCMRQNARLGWDANSARFLLDLRTQD